MPKPDVVMCPVPGCNKPRCRGYSTLCVGHARMSLGLDSPTAQDLAEWCGVRIDTARKWLRESK